MENPTKCKVKPYSNNDFDSTIWCNVMFSKNLVQPVIHNKYTVQNRIYSFSDEMHSYHLY